MLGATLHPIRSSQTLCYHARGKCRWLEVATLITAALLILLPCLALFHAKFAHMSYASPFGLACITVGVTLIIAEITYRAVLHCKSKKGPKQIPIEPPPNVEQTDAPPITPLEFSHTTTFSVTEPPIATALQNVEPPEIVQVPSLLPTELPTATSVQIVEPPENVQVPSLIPAQPPIATSVQLVEPPEIVQVPSLLPAQPPIATSVQIVEPPEIVQESTLLPEEPLPTTSEEQKNKEPLEIEEHPSSAHPPLTHIPYNCPIYSPKKLSAKEKMAKQLYYATHQNDTKKQNVEFELDLTTNTFSNHVDPFIQDKFSWVGAASRKGRRKKMEDAHVAEEIMIKGESARFVGVFDGHGDDGDLAIILKEQLANVVQEALNAMQLEFNETNLANCLTHEMLGLSEQLREWMSEVYRTGGTAAVFAIILEQAVYLINIGDSRISLVRKDCIWQLTEDARLQNPRFSRGIDKMGLTIEKDDKGVDRIQIENMGLAIARSLGVGILSRPKITCIEKGVPDDFFKEGAQIGYGEGDFLVCGSDGFWDVATNEETYFAANAMREKDLSLSAMAGYLVEAAYKAKSKDNISVVVVKL
jgi:serine/threonine protein phosphatase PrpC